MLATLALGVSFGGVPLAHAADQTVRVGIMSGEDEDVWRVVAANAAKHGITVKVTTFSEYTQPNEALSSHDLDANSFQHKPYLDAQIKARGYRIAPVGYTYVQPIGLLPTARDIAKNPKNIRIKELDSGIVGRAIDDLDAAVVNTDWAVKSGIKIPQERIAQEKVTGNPYRNFIAVNEKEANAPWVHALVESYQQANVATEILAVYHGATLPAWKGAPQQ